MVGVDMDMALRHLLALFHLPKEGQCIDRILCSFAYTWYAKNKDEMIGEEVASGRAAHRLAYSILLLNTDQHNPHLMDRMTFPQYSENLRKMNEDNDFANDFLHSLYQSIASDEIQFDQGKEKRPTAIKQGWMKMKRSQIWVVLEPPHLNLYKLPLVCFIF
jgi:golgi-specific brefeldin A-resistance guanine nucleotide exchange factor 1